MVKRMVIENDKLSHLALLLQKSLRYKHHKENYLYSLEHGIIPSRLKINKKPAFIPVSNVFTKKWNYIPRSVEDKLVNLVLSESDNVFDNLQTKIKEGLQNNFGNDIEKSFKNLGKKHQDYKNKLTSKRGKKKCELHIKSTQNTSLDQPFKGYVYVAQGGESTSLGNLNMRDIYLGLMNDESKNSSSTEITTP